MGSVRLLGSRSGVMCPRGHLGTCLHGGGAAAAEAPKPGPAGLVSADVKQDIPTSSKSPRADPLPARTVMVTTTAIGLLCTKQGAEILPMHDLG